MCNWRPGAAELLRSCGEALAPCGEALLELLLALAADPWPQVAAPARAWLPQQVGARSPSSSNTLPCQRV